MFKNIYIIFSRLILNIIITFFSSRLLLNNLGIDNYGLYNVINSFIISLSIINTILITSTNRFIAIELGKANSKINHVFNNIFSLHFLVALLILIIGGVIGYFWIFNFLNVKKEEINIAYIIFNISLFITFFNIITVPFIAFQTANDNFKNQSNLALLQSILLLIIAYLLKFANDKLLFYSFSTLVIYLFINVMQIIHTKLRYNYLMIKLSLDNNLIKEIIGYSGWMSIGAIAYMLKNQGNSIVLNLFFGTRLNASYGVSNQVYQQLNGMILNLNKVFVPKIMRSEGSGDKLYQRYMGILSSRYLFFLGLIISMPLFLNIESILHFWLINVPEYSAIFIKLLLFDMLLSLINNGISNMIFASGNVKKYQIVINTLNLLNLPITYILFKMGFEPYFLAFTSIFFTLISNIFKIYFAKKLLNLDFKYLFNNNYKYIFRVSFVGIFIYFLFKNEYIVNILKIVEISLFVELLLITFIFLIGMNSNEQKIILKKIKK